MSSFLTKMSQHVYYYNNNCSQYIPKTDRAYLLKLVDCDYFLCPVEQSSFLVDSYANELEIEKHRRWIEKQKEKKKRFQKRTKTINASKKSLSNEISEYRLYESSQ